VREGEWAEEEVEAEGGAEKFGEVGGACGSSAEA
jgi:hypothetical protein